MNTFITSMKIVSVVSFAGGATCKAIADGVPAGSLVVFWAIFTSIAWIAATLASSRHTANQHHVDE
jgi:hypothetical protein